MKRIILFAIIALLMSGCESFLDTENLVKKDNSNFPKTPADASTALTGAYALLREMTPGEDGQSFFITAELLSDDRFGGGGPDDRRMHAVDRLLKADENMFSDVWKKDYQGIFRCNMLFETMGNITWDSDETKQQIDAEARFLRAYFYFDLCRLFGTVPLITTTESVNKPRATAEELYALIASDLETAIAEFPSTKYQDMPATQLGHATKWAAEALLARAFLFYTGYYEKDAMPLSEGGSLTKAEVITHIDDCITNSGHDLLPDFRNLWPYSNSYTKPDYKYAKDNDLNWAGEEGGNYETVFAIKYSSKATWDNPWYNNEVCLYFSLREPADAEDIFPYGIGWGVGTVNSSLWEDWKNREPKDIRREASIFAVDNPDEGVSNYAWGADKQMDETGYWQKKYMAINAHKTDADGNVSCTNYSRLMYPDIDSDYQLNNTEDLVIIRFADVLLMAAELKKDAAPLNRVRARVGLPAVAYSDEALRNERRWELAFEAQRYYDLLRWHMAGEALNEQNGVEVVDNSVKTTMDVGDIAARVKDTGGFMPIPQTQIKLSSGVLTQTPGWTGDNLLY
ncbi:RagB/SusD family nutrient uptake outer membrane protein [uncultured Bacteroides sp.]|uniref:RagB/SusD family nutrient uptake outer membrane protein n=1 Tax=uncultured Bacteroides sp. TaxID=162156 RepID=UPI002AA8E3E4|nr:RagB/SusD family nutrient uptake outer membrane protein [uncultured Bacteroides sp.]